MILVLIIKDLVFEGATPCDKKVRFFLETSSFYPRR